MTLRRKTICNCQPPELEKPEVDHHWVCDDCGSTWLWCPPVTYKRAEPCGFLGLGRRIVEEGHGGFDPDWNEFICGACHDEYVPAEQRAEGGA
jgi:hypothetical protein